MATEKTLTAWVVENNMALITLLLKKAGHLTIWAKTGLIGVQMTQVLEPDFILLYIQLPDIEDTEVLRRIRALDGKVAQAPIIAITSYAMSGDKEKLLSAGCNGYLEKPIDPLNVMTQIRAIVGQSL